MSANEHNASLRQQEPQPEDLIIPENLERDVDEGIQEMEDELTQLQLHIENGEWEAAMDRVRSHPNEIMPTRSQGGNGRALTALHLACESGECPLPLLRAMLTRQPQAAAMVDRDGNTPLHNACASQFAYNPVAICLLLIAYPQATLMQDLTEESTPLHLLLLLGGDVNITCLRLIIDVAYSAVAGLRRSYIPQEDFCFQDLTTNLLTAANYPPIVIQIMREVAINDPFSFPRYLQPFIQLPAPDTIDVGPQLLDEQPQLLMIQECKLQTPLHSACARGLDLEVIRLLTCNSRYPGAHQAARTKDRKDRHPLFYAACYGVPLEAVKIIYDLYPEAALHYESYNILPLHVSYITPAYSNEDRQFEITRLREDPSAPLEDYFKLQSAIKMWRMYELFLRLTYHGSYQDPPPGCSHWRILHALGSIPSPHHFVRSAIKLYPWQLRERDEEGYLPLQRAAMCKRPEGIDENQYWLPRGINQRALYVRCLREDRPRDNSISIFLEGDSSAAGVLDKDMKLPLHWAIESGKQWNEGVESLVNAAPLGLATRDGQNHLYPFMMAALTGNVSLTLDILLANPMVVQSAIVPQTVGPLNVRHGKWEGSPITKKAKKVADPV
jgi:ankyrin repeat protein